MVYDKMRKFFKKFYYFEILQSFVTENCALHNFQMRIPSRYRNFLQNARMLSTKKTFLTDAWRAGCLGEQARSADQPRAHGRAGCLVEQAELFQLMRSVPHCPHFLIAQPGNILNVMG